MENRESSSIHYASSEECGALCSHVKHQHRLDIDIVRLVALRYSL